MDKKERIIGFDFARSLAILGMIIVNYKIVMSYGIETTGFINVFANLIEGRAAATFVMLAGIGISLMTRKSYFNREPQLVAKNKKVLLIRSVFLFVVGLAYTPLWPADILHFYGVYIAISVLFLFSKNKTLVSFSVLTLLIFPLLAMFFNYEQGWNWTNFEYANFWTINGMIRNLFFNGFHPVFPWLSFLLFGMYLGRLDWTNKHLRKRMVYYSIAVFLVSELPSIIMNSTSIINEINKEGALFLLSTKPMPPTPFYILSASATSILVILLSIYIAEKYQNTLIKSFILNGRMALTIYVAHVIIGMGLLEELGMLYNQPVLFSVIYSFMFFITTVIFSFFWFRKFNIGPLEWIMRKVSDYK